MCCIYEDKYAAMYERLQESASTEVKFARVDVQSADFIKKFVSNIDDVPKLYAIVRGTFYPYVEETNGWIMYRFVRRMQEPVIALNSAAEYHKFWDDARIVRRVIGVVYDADRDEESDYGKFAKIAYVLASLGAFEVGLVTDRSVIKQLKSEKSLLYYDSILVKNSKNAVKVLDQATKSTETDPLFWILLNSLEPVEELTTFTLGIYQRLGLPMLLLFLNPQTLKNDGVIEDATKIAENFRGKLTISWVDGTNDLYKEKRKELGLMGEALPAAAFNLQEDRILPFDESLPFTYDNLNSFVLDFLNNRLVSKPRTRTKRRSYEIDSILSQIAPLTYNDFAEKATTEGEDVCIFFYSTNESNKEVVEKSKIVARTFAQLFTRLADLPGNTVKLYCYDLAVEAPPRGVSVAYTPSVFFLPAYQKSQPYAQYVGDNHYLKLMLFIAGTAERPVRLPKLAEMIGDEKEVYQSTKADLPHKIVAMIEADEKVRDAEWL